MRYTLSEFGADEFLKVGRGPGRLASPGLSLILNVLRTKSSSQTIRYRPRPVPFYHTPILRFRPSLQQSLEYKCTVCKSHLDSPVCPHGSSRLIVPGLPTRWTQLPALSPLCRMWTAQGRVRRPKLRRNMTTPLVRHALGSSLPPCFRERCLLIRTKAPQTRSKNLIKTVIVHYFVRPSEIV